MYKDESYENQNYKNEFSDMKYLRNIPKNRILQVKKMPFRIRTTF